MNKKTFVIHVLALSMLLLFVSPIMASRTRNTYTLALVGWTEVPGSDKLSANKIMHTRGGIGNQIIYGSPWGDGTAESIGVMNFNIIYFTGTGLEHAIDSFTAGTFEGLVNYKITGFGIFTYDGPTFTYEGVEVEAGDQFSGILFSGIVVKHGTSGDLDGLQLRGNMYGVAVADIPDVWVNPPELVDNNLVYETGYYW
ncbi:MAG: hypothetical protein P8Y18_03855 [Candidatus Bathyarchaeota archaeon]